MINDFFKPLKERYFDLVTEKLLIKKEDLTETEIKIMEIGYDLIAEKIEDMRILQDDMRRLSIDFLNYKNYSDNKDYYSDDDE